ncbi:MAG: T9SS type A sorting domain-containing protein [Flavobacteriales bacterium]|nr:T9SS type A sorting domain-containing protein [Flavobacteriales bacterium]MBK6943910.1 T9SS type A sorting domain-containing protein [Flavobacteriales bacterium]MBK9533581.1 T9SS type A sorting domain-containing protein [Flavobacteriales bacterium]MBP9136871.1 T9SS type A sorting domain-containing protein [Flavobacteriales bacterium]HQV51664.1 T9SS type A sorting domain-containing protein [Flavobacteriales bacterium]
MNYAATTLCALFLALGPTTFAQPGSLDASFDGDGKVTTDFGSMNAQGASVAIRPDGKLVVVGTVTNNSLFAFGAVGYNVDGSLDTDFGTNGKVATNMGLNNASVYAVAVQSDGKIIMAGGAYIGSTYVFALARYNPDGTLDTSFGTDGKVTTAVGSGGPAEVGSLAIQSDGKIIAAGGAYEDVSQIVSGVFALVRYNPDGTLDTDFGVDGRSTTEFGYNFARIRSVAIQPDGKIVAVGVSHWSPTFDIALARYNVDGSLDNSFSDDGKLTTDLGYDQGNGNSVVIQPDGKILLAGSIGSGSASDFVLIRYNTDGTPDTDFGTDGHITTDIAGGFDDTGNSVILQPDGKVLLAGTSYNAASTDFALVRYNADGTPDPDLGSVGIVITDFNGFDDMANSSALQPDGNIIVAGYANDGTDYAFAVARYLSGLNVGIIDLSVANDNALIYPNPIGMHATLEYTLQHAERISIHLLDMQGRTVHTFIEGQEQASGYHQQRIELPEALPSGTYLIAISSPKGRLTVQVVK